MSLESQDKFIREQWSIPLRCPSCREKHSMMELVGERYNPSKPYPEIKCPKTGEILEYKIGLFAGEQWFDIKVTEL